jgi:hypothetical protein
MNVLTFVNRRARTRIIRIGQFLYSVAHGQTVVLEAEHASFAKAAGLEVLS